MTSKKDYPISIGEKQYLLRYNFDALTFIEDVTGKPFFESLSDLQSGRLKFLKMIFYAGLKRNHPDIELDDVGELIDEAGNLQELLINVITALNNYFAKTAPQAKKKNVEPDPEVSTEVTAG